MYERPFVGTPTDYADADNWLVRPPADAPLLDTDVVFLIPSACMDPEAGKVCTVDNPTLRMIGATYYPHQIAAFEGVGNIYAPWWRQVNGALLSAMSYEEIDELEFAEPRTDVYAALDYYFENYNGGRPFILAGHSQGSRLIGMVLAEYMIEHPDRYERMIAAYRIGDGLTKPYLAANPHVKPAQAADDLGVCISWNTEGPANIGKSSLVVPPDCVCINPLNWRTDEEYASSDLNPGCIIANMLDYTCFETDGIADARVNLERGVVIVEAEACKPYSVTASMGELGAMFEPVFGPESYHGCDYGFFFYNIRENAALRAQRWRETH